MFNYHYYSYRYKFENECDIENLHESFSSLLTESRPTVTEVWNDLRSHLQTIAYISSRQMCCHKPWKYFLLALVSKKKCQYRESSGRFGELMIWTIFSWREVFPISSLIFVYLPNLQQTCLTKGPLVTKFKNH